MAILDAVTAAHAHLTPANFLLASAAALAVFLLALLYARTPPAYPFPTPPRDKESFPIIGPRRFWTTRWDYMREASARSPTGNWMFNVGPWDVVGIDGEAARRMFFESRDLHLGEGYRTLFYGATTDTKADSDDDGNVKDKKDWDGYLLARIKMTLQDKRLHAGMSAMHHDVRRALNDLGNSGATDPFQSLYALAFRLSMRAFGPEEIADSDDAMTLTMSLFDQLESAVGPVNILFPWLYTPHHLLKFVAGTRLYMLFDRIIKARQADGVRKNDTTQHLLDEGDKADSILAFTFNCLFAAQLNTGINAASTLCYLGVLPEWRQKLREEVRATAAKYASDDSASLLDQLAHIPYEEWANGFPLLYACQEESIRQQTIGTFFRRNTSGKPVPIPSADGVTREYVPPGACVALNGASYYNNDALYPSSLDYVPERHVPDTKAYAQQDRQRQEAHSAALWGAGRHPCAGKRLGRLEMNLIDVYFIALFDWELVDAQEQPCPRFHTNFNRFTTTKPEDVYKLQYRQIGKAQERS